MISDAGEATLLSDAEKAALRRRAEELRQLHAARAAEPVNVAGSARELVERKLALRPLDPEAARKAEERRAAQATLQVAELIASRLKSIFAALGPRYERCSFESFQFHGGDDAVAAQQTVVSELRNYLDDMQANVQAGAGILLFGPTGTGKDHLLVPLIREAILKGFAVHWVNGPELWLDKRTTHGDDADLSERRLFDQLTRPDVLVLSDPMPPVGDMSPPEFEFLYTVVNHRYRWMRPVWVTMNVEDGNEARQRIGSQVVDRLADNGLLLECKWPTHRRPK